LTRYFYIKWIDNEEIKVVYTVDTLPDPEAMVASPSESSVRDKGAL